MDDIQRAQRETFEGVEVGPPIWVEGIPQADLAAAEKEWSCRRASHRRLFGHSLARVFIVCDQLLVVRPQGGAA